MLATALAMAAAATLPPSAANRTATGLRVEAVVVRPPTMPSVRQAGRGLVIDNPDAVAISVDNQPATADLTLRVIGEPTIRRITYIF